MKSIELSKQIVSNTVKKSWDVATAPTRLSLHTINAFVGLMVDNSEYSNQRKQIAERLGNLHHFLKQSTEKVQYRMAGETEVYSVKMNESNTIIFYYRKQKAGYKVSVEQRLIGEYHKVQSTLYGPLFLAEHLGTIRPFQHADRISPNQELSQGQMVNLTILLDLVFAKISKA